MDTHDSTTPVPADGGKRLAKRIFAIANQKGGVGKTTTAINLGTALASLGRRVLIIDLDPQGNASTGLGIERHDRHRSTYEVLHRETPLHDAVVASPDIAHLSIIPSTVKLSGADAELMRATDGRYRLRDALNAAHEAASRSGETFDYVLIDCPPSLNLLT
ncbi:MAG: AAA family ATPase, partial [Pseudomonadota bacterium]